MCIRDRCLVVWCAEQSRKFLVVVQHPNIALRHVAVQFNQQMSHSVPHSTSVGVLQHVCVYLVDDGCSRIPATSVNPTMQMQILTYAQGDIIHRIQRIYREKCKVSRRIFCKMRDFAEISRNITYFIKTTNAYTTSIPIIHALIACHVAAIINDVIIAITWLLNNIWQTTLIDCIWTSWQNYTYIRSKLLKTRRPIAPQFQFQFQ